MSLTRMAIEKDRVTIIILLVLGIFGVQSYLSMPQQEDPGFLIRTAVVVTRFPGASPLRVEQLVTDKLEKAIQEMPEIDSIVSTSKTGVSIINVNIQERYSDLRPIWDSLRRKVDRTVDELPEGVIGPNVDDEFGDVFGTVISLVGDGLTPAELEDVADEVRDELLLLEDVAKVEIYGRQEERVYAEYSNARLAELGLSPGQLQQILASRNIINPGGSFRTPFEQVVIEPSGNFESLEDIAATLIPQPDGRLVRLDEILTLRRGDVDPPTERTRINGEPGLALAVSLRKGGNIVTLGTLLTQRVREINDAYPIGVEMELVLDQAEIVEDKVDAFVGNLLQAIGIVLAVMLISLGLRTGLVVASLIPMAILLAFIGMPWMGVGIDQMSLAALIISLGLLVDNAIVISESILVSMEEGRSALEAAVGSVDELRTSLLVSSLTTSAAFLPIYLAESAVGEYTGALFKVVTLTLLCSWLLALTMVPLLCVKFLRVKKSGREVEPKGAREQLRARVGQKLVPSWLSLAGYRALLGQLLRHPWLSLTAVAGALVFAGFLLRFVPVIFFPDSDRATFSAVLRMPTGTPLETTEEVIAGVENFITDELMVEPGSGADGVVDFTTFIGGQVPMFVLGFSGSQASPEFSSTIVNTTTRDVADEAASRLRAHCAEIPGLEATVEPLSAGPGSSTPIEVRVSGRDKDTVFRLAETVKTRLARMPGLLNVRDDWGARSKKLLVEVAAARAQRAGVTHQDVAISLQTSFSGLVTTEYRDGKDVIPVMLRSKQADDISQLGSLNVFSQASGRSVPADQVADIEVAWQPAKILRRNRLPTVTVQADLEPGLTASEVNAELQPWLRTEGDAWPHGYDWELGGEDESANTANQSIVDKLPIAFLGMLLLLVGQFNSVRKTAIIGLTVPLSLIGVVVGLLVLKSYFGFMTLLGMISLAGIVINNAIVLLDRIQLEIDVNGLAPSAAIIASAERRFRPIMLTTFTTLGGMIPLYLGGGPMFEPMAAAIMFGLVFATVLTLGVVPILYSLFYRVERPAA